MFQDIDIEELLVLKQTKELKLIDVRSPAEFADFTIPQSLNIPLFDDGERQEIGTLYKQVSAKAAQDRGLEIVSAKLPSFIKRFEQIADRKVVYCWRGGMRSKTTATVLSLMGIHVYRLKGGIRAYRNWVHQTLAQQPLIPRCIVISGNTGTGKTQILHRLQAKGYPVIDLEHMAQHRGSIFGHIHLKPNNQKQFEALLLEQLIAHREQPYILMEAESRRIGKVVIPEYIIQHKEQGILLQVHLPIEQRVQAIIHDYQPTLDHHACREAFERIRKRIHTPIAMEIEQQLNSKNYESVVALLLNYYYDPRYRHAGLDYTHVPIDFYANDIDDATNQIEQWLQT